MSLRSVAVVFNPAAGGGRLLRSCASLERVASERGVRLEWLHTRGPGHAEELARAAVVGGRELLLAFGGDGTYNEAARGLLGSSTALGVLPGGTTSVLAYELAVPRPAEAALVALLGGRDRTMRVGRTSQGQLFLLMLSAGPDALVLERLSPRLKRIGGKLGVAAQACREFVRGGRSARLRVRWDRHELDGGWSIVGNSRCYGGPFPATPGADPFAPSLELVLLERSDRMAAARFALAIPSGRHVEQEGVTQATVTRIVLEPEPGSDPLPFQVDGDLVGHLPVEAWVDPAVLKVRMPA